MMSNLPFATFEPIIKSSRQLAGSQSAEAPVRVVVDSVSASSIENASVSYLESGIVPHFTVDFINQDVFQHLSLDESAIGVSKMPVESHKIGRTIWVMAMTPAGVAPCTSESYWLGQMVGKIAEAVGATEYWEPFPSRSSMAYKTSEMTLGAWREFEGICAAAHVPLCTRYGPGEVDLWAFGEGLTGGDAAVSDVKMENVDAAPEFAEPTVVDLLAAEFSENLEAKEPTVGLGGFPGRKVQLGSGGQAVNALRAAYGLGEGKFDDELHDIILAEQESAGMTADGIVDASVWEVLDRSLVSQN